MYLRGEGCVGVAKDEFEVFGTAFLAQNVGPAEDADQLVAFFDLKIAPCGKIGLGDGVGVPGCEAGRGVSRQARTRPCKARHLQGRTKVRSYRGGRRSHRCPVAPRGRPASSASSTR